MFSQMIEDLRLGRLPDPESLKGRLKFALTKKMGIISQPKMLWPGDPKINPPAKHILWAAIILEDADDEPAIHERLHVDKESLENSSYTYGNVIVIGFYNDKEIKLAAFFHEVGHKIAWDPKRSIFENERQCWIAGLRLATKYGVVFGEKVDAYIEKCLDTYTWTKYLKDGVDETEARRLDRLAKSNLF